MREADYMQDTREMLMHGLVLATILVFWAVVSQLVGFGIEAANLSSNLSASIAGTLGQTGIVNAALYILVVAVRNYRE
ncbi:MAG: hypothetical protein BRC27_00840 [Nanohaloarchaea archaeon SW_10_44_10]|nr:MAG: hypothetical protein BRC27_00840 [Nanohaloarchaea archaeon SW_10_44_10]